MAEKLKRGTIEFEDPNFRPNTDKEESLMGMAEKTLLYQMGTSFEREKYNKLVHQLHDMLDKLNELFSVEEVLLQKKIAKAEEGCDADEFFTLTGKLQGLQRGAEITGQAIKEIFDESAT